MLTTSRPMPNANKFPKVSPLGVVAGQLLTQASTHITCNNMVFHKELPQNFSLQVPTWSTNMPSPQATLLPTSAKCSPRRMVHSFPTHTVVITCTEGSMSLTEEVNLGRANSRTATGGVDAPSERKNATEQKEENFKMKGSVGMWSFL